MDITDREYIYVISDYEVNTVPEEYNKTEQK
jgi:hypothetical protein